MAGMYGSSQEVRDELIAVCRECGIKVENSTPTIIYAVSDDPRASLVDIRDRLQRTIFREYAIREGDQEAYVTVLDSIDRPITVKVRRLL